MAVSLVYVMNKSIIYHYSLTGKQKNRQIPGPCRRGYRTIPKWRYARSVTTLPLGVRLRITAVAFDSGGVASGPMTATFLLPFAMGACEAVGGNVLSDAFGVVAMVAMTPLITIQLLGLWSLIRAKRNPEKIYDDLDETELIEFE